jgi:hypothetical protein
MHGASFPLTDYLQANSSRPITGTQLNSMSFDQNLELEHATLPALSQAKCPNDRQTVCGLKHLSRSMNQVVQASIPNANAGQ